MMLEVNIPEVLAEVTAAFHRYEKALTSNDVEVLDELFWNSGHTVRLGITENLYGWDQIANFRAGRPAKGLARGIHNTVITTFGCNFGTANTEFQRVNSTRKGRQSHSWARMPEGWRIVAAHVSFMDEPAA
jgi:hypothetical protein